MLDLLFLQGMHSNKVIFDITLGYLMLLNNEVSQCKDQIDLQKVLNSVTGS
jgi:hypothetical protein